MSYTLAAAARTTGLNKWMVLRLIRSGEITGTQDLFGEWHVEPAELHRLYPPADEHQAAEEREAGSDAAQSLALLEAAIATVVRDAAGQLRRQVDDARHDEVEDNAGQHLRQRWWRRLAG